MNASRTLHVDLDGAWPRDALAAGEYIDAGTWGAPLRYSTTRKLAEQFYEFIQPQLAAFTLYGSGDFHYLTALWLRRIAEPFTLVSFDNHPDWDVRPPHWCCGTWINRALELKPLRHVAIWGCGNFELNWPHRLFANHRALHAGRLQIWPWSERIGASSRKHWPGMTREDWRAHFSQFAASSAREKIYVTVDLDCLLKTEAATNWESGLFTAGEVAWALSELRASGAEILGGDLCGAYSPVRYTRWKQRLGGIIDHPRDDQKIDPAEAVRRNLRALNIIWPELVR